MDDRLQPIAVEAKGRYGDGFLRAIDAALAVRPQDRPQNEAQFRALLDIDLPTPPPSPPLSGYGGLSHEPYPAMQDSGYSTVPGTLSPELATQVQARVAEPPLPPTAIEAPPATLAPTARQAPIRQMPAPQPMRRRRARAPCHRRRRAPSRSLHRPPRQGLPGRAQEAGRGSSARQRCWSSPAWRSLSTGRCSPVTTTPRSRPRRRHLPSHAGLGSGRGRRFSERGARIGGQPAGWDSRGRVGAIRSVDRPRAPRPRRRPRRWRSKRPSRS
jgi:hypothetical protein